MFLRLLAYFVPFAINFLNGGFFFITALRFSQANCSAVTVGCAVTAWGVAYCLTTPLVGKFSNEKNALKFILAGGIMLSAVSAGFIIFFNHIYSQFVFLTLAGLGGALFCTPFQLLAKRIESGSKRGTVSATAFYTATWSIGFASGPLAFARLAPRSGFFVTLALAILVTLSVIAIACIQRKQKPALPDCPMPETKAPQSIFSESTYTRLAILGWIVGGLGTVTICQIRTMWPKLGAELNFPRDHIAYVLALVSYVQAFVAILLCNSKSWMWKRFPAVLMSACGVSSLLLFAFANNLWIFYLAAVIYGTYTGSLYFYLVYHSLAHPKRSNFFVAGNEVIVGVTSMLSPLLGGALADIFKFTGSAFIFAAMITTAAFICQLVMLAPKKIQQLVD